MSSWRTKYRFDIDGQISQILSNETAEIQFMLDGEPEKALLKKGRFYHYGKPIPDHIPLTDYIRNNMQVIFSCHILDPFEGSPPYPYQNVQYNWFATICQANNIESSLMEVTITSGIFATMGVISSIKKRHGVISMTDGKGKEQKVAFLASKVYIHGKRFAASKMLNTTLCVDEKMVFDCVPCIPEENRDNCKWFATCAFQGKRPRLADPSDINTKFHDDYLLQKPRVSGKDGNDKIHLVQQTPANLKYRLFKFIKLHTTNPRTLFTTGYGFIFDIINEEFGIILGCFKKNVYQTVLFHRTNAFLFKVPLARENLSEIFMEGDRMKFIAVGAPPKFYTDWIAVQVCVSTSVYRAKDAVAM